MLFAGAGSLVPEFIGVGTSSLMAGAFTVLVGNGGAPGSARGAKISVAGSDRSVVGGDA